MNTRIARISETATSKETQEIYFLKDAFTLIEEGKEDWYCKQIAKAIQNSKFIGTEFPILICKLSYISDNQNPYFGHYTAICLNASGEIYPITINISDTEILDASARKQTAYGSKPNRKLMTTPEPQIEDVMCLPDMFNPSNPANYEMFKTLQGVYIQSLVKSQEEQAKQFLAARHNPRVIFPEPPQHLDPVLTENTLDIAITTFPQQLSHLTALIEMDGKNRTAIADIQTQIDSALTNVDPAEADKIIAFFFTENIASIQNTIAEHHNQVQDTVENISNETSSLQNEMPKMQATLAFIKKYFAWALYRAACEYYKDIILEQTNNNPSERKTKIVQFNNDFADIVQINEDGTLSNIEVVYDNFTKKSLTDIKKMIDILLNRSDRLFKSSDQLSLLIDQLNDAARTLDVELTSDLMFDQGKPVVSKNSKLWSAKEFNWPTAYLLLEDKIQTQHHEIQKHFIEDDIYTRIKPVKKTSGTTCAQMDTLRIDQNIIKYLKTQKNTFLNYMRDHASLCELRASAKITHASAQKIQEEANAIVDSLQQATKKIVAFKKTNPDNQLIIDPIDYDAISHLQKVITKLILALEDNKRKIEQFVLTKQPKKRAQQLEKIEDIVLTIKEIHEALLNKKQDLDSIQMEMDITLQDIASYQGDMEISTFKKVIDEQYEAMYKLNESLQIPSSFSPDPKLERILRKFSNNMQIVKSMQERYRENRFTNLDLDSKALKRLHDENLRLYPQIKKLLAIRNQVEFLKNDLIQSNKLITIYDQYLGKLLNTKDVQDPRLASLIKRYNDNKKKLATLSAECLRDEVADEKILQNVTALIEEGKNAFRHLQQAYFAINEFENYRAFSTYIVSVGQTAPDLNNISNIKTYLHNKRIHELIVEFQNCQMRIEQMHATYTTETEDLHELIFSIDAKKDELHSHRGEMRQIYQNIKEQIIKLKVVAQFQSQLDMIDSQTTLLTSQLPDNLDLTNNSPLSLAYTQYFSCQQALQQTLQNNRVYLEDLSASSLDELQKNTLQQFFNLKKLHAVLIGKEALQIDDQVDYSDEANEENVKVDDATDTTTTRLKFLPSAIYKNPRQCYIKFYNLLVDSIHMLQAKMDELNQAIDKQSPTHEDAEHKLKIVQIHLELLTKLRSKIELEILGEDLEPYRQAIKDQKQICKEHPSDKRAKLDLKELKKQYHAHLIISQNISTLNLQFNLGQFQATVDQFHDQMQTYLQDKKTASKGFAAKSRYWLGRFRENFINNVRKLSSFTSLNPYERLSTVEASRTLKKHLGSQFKLFNKRYGINARSVNNPNMLTIPPEPPENNIDNT